MTTEKTAFAVMISSDLIAEVMGRYFNNEMFKRQVRIVDLKGDEDGYVFNLDFAEHPLQQEVMHTAIQQQGAKEDAIAQDTLRSAKNIEYVPNSAHYGTVDRTTYPPKRKAKV